MTHKLLKKAATIATTTVIMFSMVMLFFATNDLAIKAETEQQATSTLQLRLNN